MIANSDDFQADLPNSGGLITSTVRGVEIRLSPESICRIFDISSVELWMYESKAWPTVLGFEVKEAIQRMCGLADAQGMGKPSAHSLTMISRVLHHMIASSYCHGENIETMSPTLRHSLWTPF